MLISCFLQTTQHTMRQQYSDDKTAITQPLSALFCSFDFFTISPSQVRLVHTLSPQR